MYASPFQTLCGVQPVGHQKPFLLAASGPIISSFNLKDGSLLSQWPRSKKDSGSTNGEEGPSPKRRRLDEDRPEGLSREESEESLVFISERKKGERRKPKVESSTLPNVSHILVTSDAKTAICVTSEDKSITVFDLMSEGVLELKNQRAMPKRVCAIVLTPDEKNIVVGDKFGDVYLLPLHPTEGWVPSKSNGSEQQAPYTPSATELTVHTKGNLEALKQQRSRKAPPPKKEGPQFECKLLLGHVSLLTDVIVTELPVGLKARQYILTADRDEHIRVSRGITQAHIIENYCYGHREFVSKLCIVPWNVEFLVSGSGEPSLKVYHWRTGELLDEELFKGGVKQDIINCLALDDGERSLDRLAVSNIWPIHYTVSGSAPRSRQPPHLLVVAFEGLPLLLSYSLTGEGRLSHHQTLTLGGNVLDVGVGPSLWEIIVSVDTVHTPGSMKAIRPEEVPNTQFFETFELFSNLSQDPDQEVVSEDATPEMDLRWESSSLAMFLNQAAAEVEKGQLPSETSSKDKGAFSVAGEILYGLENLRKKRGQAAMEAEQEEAGDEAEVIPDTGDMI